MSFSNNLRVNSMLGLGSDNTENKFDFKSKVNSFFGNASNEVQQDKLSQTHDNINVLLGNTPVKNQQTVKNNTNSLANRLNPYLNNDGGLLNKYINYQELLDNNKTSDKAKDWIKQATGLDETSSKNNVDNKNSETMSSDISTSGFDLTSGKHGFVSAKYETGGWDPGLVSSGSGDYGGISYGLPQFSTTTGSAKSFVNWLKQTNPEMGNIFGDTSPGTADFGNAWKQCYSKYGDTFANAQTTYAFNNMVKPLADLAKQKTGIDYTSSEALYELIYSTAIQFGGGSLGLSALGDVNSSMSESDIINASYDKKINNVGSFFRSSSGDVQQSVANRFSNERNDILALVGKTSSLGGSSSSSGKYSSAVGQKVANTSSYSNDAAKGQCVWYVRGRASEKLGKDTGAIGNANEMYNNVSDKAKVQATAANLKPDMIASFSQGTSSAGKSYGHVVYIEDVKGDTVYYTEGGSGYYANGTDGVVKTASKQEFLSGVNSQGSRFGSGIIGLIDVNKL